MLLCYRRSRNGSQTTSKFVLQLRSARGHRHCPCGVHVSVSTHPIGLAEGLASSSKVRHLLAIRSAGPEINPDRRPTFELTGYLSPRAYNAATVRRHNTVFFPLPWQTASSWWLSMRSTRPALEHVDQSWTDCSRTTFPTLPQSIRGHREPLAFFCETTSRSVGEWDRRRPCTGSTVMCPPVWLERMDGFQLLRLNEPISKCPRQTHRGKASRSRQTAEQRTSSALQAVAERICLEGRRESRQYLDMKYRGVRRMWLDKLPYKPPSSARQGSLRVSS